MDLDFLDSPTEYYAMVVRTQYTQYVSVAAMAALVWDWLTRIEAEIDTIWIREWRLAGKPLYLFIRYGGMLYQVYDLVHMMGYWSAKFCTAYFVQLPIGTTLFLFTVDAILAWRLLILYRMDKILLIVNIVIFFACLAVTIIMAFYSFPRIGAVDSPPYLPSCWATLTKTVYSATVPPIVFEIWLFLLVLYKLYCHTKKFGTPTRGNLADLLLKDSMRWFFIIALLAIWNGLMLGIAPEGIRSIGLPMSRAFVVIGGCRLIIHMRQEVYRQRERPMVLWSSQTTSEALYTIGTPEPVTPVRQWCVDAARFVGLPPPSRTLLSMWPDPERATVMTTVSEATACDKSLTNKLDSPGADLPSPSPQSDTPLDPEKGVSYTQAMAPPLPGPSTQRIRSIDFKLEPPNGPQPRQFDDLDA